MEDLWSPRRGGKATWARQLFCLAALCLGCLATGLGSVQHSQLRPQLLRTCSTRGLRDVVKPPKPKQQPPNRPKSWGSDGHNGNPPAASSTEVCLASSDPGCFPSSGRLQVLRKRGPLMHLMKTVKQGRWMQGDAIVVLFHARWCPYSQALLPLMECLPLHFPSSKLQFFAVDESDVGLRTLIQLGIDAFPVLQVVQPHKTRDWGQTMAVQGPRQLGHIIDKITKITGVEHCTREAFCKHYAVATCPPRTLGIRNPRGNCSGAGSVSCGAAWGSDDWERDARCLRLLDEPESLATSSGQDWLAWAAVAFLVLRCSFLFAKWRRARGHGGRGADDEQQQGAEGGDHEDEGGWEGDRGVAGEEVGDVDTEGSETESEEALLGDVAPGGIR